MGVPISILILTVSFIALLALRDITMRLVEISAKLDSIARDARHLSNAEQRAQDKRDREEEIQRRAQQTPDESRQEKWRCPRCDEMCSQEWCGRCEATREHLQAWWNAWGRDPAVRSGNDDR